RALQYLLVAVLQVVHPRYPPSTFLLFYLMGKGSPACRAGFPGRREKDFVDELENTDFTESSLAPANQECLKKPLGQQVKMVHQNLRFFFLQHPVENQVQEPPDALLFFLGAFGEV
ncbi:hypothetical protein SAMN02745218_03015, partial [Desulfofundulus australicus DSM 11792]